MLAFVERTLGYVFYNYKAGEEKALYKSSEFNTIPTSISLTSIDIQAGKLSKRTSAEGENKSPALEIQNIPDNAKSLALVLQDIDPPLPFPVLHLLAYNIEPSTKEFSFGFFNEIPPIGDIRYGYGFRKRIGYAGPRPIRSHGAHRYVFQVFAIDDTGTSSLRDLKEPCTLENFVKLVEGHVLSQGHIVGTYERF